MTLPAPMTPPDCDLQDFPFIPLHVARLRDSDLAAEECPEACWYAVLLWAAAWHQLPAGSLPDNDAVLTKLIGLGRDVRTFKKHRAGALRGFVKCSDGRLYHPVVAEQANAAWDGKLQQRWRTECGRIKKANQRNGTDLPAPTYEEFIAALSVGTSAQRPAPVPEDNGECPEGQGLQEKGTGTGRLKEGSVSDETDAAASSDQISELRALPVAKGCWRLAVLVLTEQGGLAETKARTFTGKLKGLGLSDEELWEVCEAAWRTETRDPVAYLTKAAEGVVERRGSVLIDAPSERQQRSWMEDWRDKGRPAWRQHERGAYPGEEGCRVAPAIQREFGVEPFTADLLTMGRAVA